ncbi:MAG TPA: BON domain-containing protein [Casimicrobiaceae bacterium]
MTKQASAKGHWLRAATAAVLGAAGMFLFDPDKGRRRRALARDWSRHATANVAHAARTAARDIAHRMQGIEAQALREFRCGDTPDDLQLIERVRAALGRAVSNPHAIQVGANRGRVVLSGPVLAAEAATLVDAVSGVAGVSAVDNELVVHDEPGSVPSLQTDPRAHRRRTTHWAPAMRAGALVGGAAAVAYGLRRRTPATLALAVAGAALAARAATDRPLAKLLGPVAPARHQGANGSTAAGETTAGVGEQPPSTRSE